MKFETLKQVFFGRVVHNKSLNTLNILARAALGVDEQGLIKFLDDKVASAENACIEYEEFKGAVCTSLTGRQFLFPGLIDCHLRAPQWPNLAIEMEGDLQERIERYANPMEASYKDNDKAERVYSEMVQKELELGTTTCAYNSTIHAEATNILADMCLKYGQRGIIGKLCVLSDSTHEDTEFSSEESLDSTQQCLEYMKKIDPDEQFIIPCVQPRGGPWALPKLMAGLSEKSHNNGAKKIRVQAHMCETLSDVANTLKIHPDFSKYTEMYQSYGLLHERSVMGHCIHLSDRDIELLAETKAGVAHNPNSNACLRAGECRVREVLNAGAKLAKLSIDCSAGYSTSMLDSMRQASNVSRHIAIHTGDTNWTLKFAEIVYLATVGSAQVVSLEDKLGNFEPGKLFDALIVDTRIDDCINVTEWGNGDLAIVKKWVFMGEDRSIRKVFVNGKLVAGKER